MNFNWKMGTYFAINFSIINNVGRFVDDVIIPQA